MEELEEMDAYADRPPTGTSTAEDSFVQVTRSSLSGLDQSWRFKELLLRASPDLLCWLHQWRHAMRICHCEQRVTTILHHAGLQICSTDRILAFAHGQGVSLDTSWTAVSCVLKGRDSAVEASTDEDGEDEDEDEADSEEADDEEWDPSLATPAVGRRRRARSDSQEATVCSPTALNKKRHSFWPSGPCMTLNQRLPSPCS